MIIYPPVPFPRSYWVVPGKLLAGYYPGDLDTMKMEGKQGQDVLDVIEKLRRNDPNAYHPLPETPQQRDMVTTWQEGA